LKYPLFFVKSYSSSLQEVEFYPILMLQAIETVGNPDYSCLFSMEPIVIWCYQAFLILSVATEIRRDFCKVCFELHEIDFAAQNPCSILVGLTPKS